MRYFTPQLYEALNAGNEALALRTLRKWYALQDKYRAELGRWIEQATPGVRDLAMKFYGHDGEVVARGRIGESIYYLFFVSESREETVICYHLLSEPLLIRHESSASCWEGDVHWLYDEVTRIAEGRYRYEILFSDGRILQIEFSDVAIRSWPARKSKDRARPRVELTMPDPASDVNSLPAAMKLWKITRPGLRKRKPVAKRRAAAKVA